MQAALLWVVMVVGPDFTIEPRWGPLRFPERTQCENGWRKRCIAA